MENGSGSSPTLLDRFFDAIPLAPAWIAVALAAISLASLSLMVTLSGDMAQFVAEDRRWWEMRDARIGILLGVLTAALLATRRYERLGAERNLQDLRERIDWRPGEYDAIARQITQPRRASMFLYGGLALLFPPLFGFLVDRSLSLYFQGHYWGTPQIWSWSIGAIACWNIGVLIYFMTLHRRCFHDLASAIPRVDFLDLGALAPFTRQALRASLPGLLFLSFVAFQSVDPGFTWVVAGIGPFALASAIVPPILSLRGVQQRLRAAKQTELSRVRRALRGEPDAMKGSLLEARAHELSFGDLLAYRNLVADVPEWPMDSALRLRVLLYAAIPVGSWLGGALVERLVNAALD